MNRYNILKNIEKNHFIFKLRFRQFDKEAGILFIESLKSITNDNELFISKELMSEVLFFLNIYHNQIEYFVKELEEEDWKDLYSIMCEIYDQIRRILSSSNN